MDYEGLDPYDTTWRELLDENSRRVNFSHIHDWLQISSPPWYRKSFSEELRDACDPVIYRDKAIMAWQSVSPSQIDNFNKCKRLWFFKSIVRLPEPQKNFQATGEATHLLLEKIDQPDQPFPRKDYEYSHSDVNADNKQWEIATALAKVMAPKIPKPVTGKRILREHKIAMDTYPGGPTMIGYVDLGVGPGIGAPALLIPKDDKSAIVIDYKTLSDFRYMKSPAELASNVQMTTYGKWAVTPGDLVAWDEEPPEQVYLAHLYGRTKAPVTNASVRSEIALLTRPQIDLEWNKTLDIVREMQQTATCGDAQDVEPTGTFNDHCNAYGGCAFRKQCGLSTESPIKNLFQIIKKPSTSPGETDVSTTNPSGSPLMAKILAARAAAAGTQAPASTPAPAPVQETTPAAPVTPTPAPVGDAPKPNGPISALLAQIHSKHGGKPAISGIIAVQFAKEQAFDKPGTSYPGDGALAGTTVTSIDGLVKLANVVAPTMVASGLIPSDAPPREQPVITKPGDQVADPEVDPEDTAAEGENTSLDDSASAAVAAAIAASPTTGVASPGNTETAEQTAKRRGRPTNAELAEKRAAEAKALDAEVEKRVQERLASLGHTLSTTVAPEWERMSADLEQAKREANAERDLAEKRKNDNRAMYADMVKAQKELADLQARGAGPATQEGFTLYVDTYPTKGAPSELIDYLEWYAPIAAGVASAASVDDWRLINYTAKGMLAQAMREVVKTEGVPKGAMVIGLNAPGADVALEVLAPHAKRVIKPMRG